jgi:hypothetical protein
MLQAARFSLRRFIIRDQVDCASVETFASFGKAERTCCPLEERNV